MSLEEAVIRQCILDQIEDSLAGRQLEVFRFLRLGYSKADIARMLGLSPGTIRRYWFDIKKKAQRFCDIDTIGVGRNLCDDQGCPANSTEM